MALRARTSVGRAMACLVLGFASPAAAEAPHATLEVDAFGGLVKRNGPAVAEARSTRNGGLALAVTVLLRTRYPFAPFVDVGYYPLLASDRVVSLDGRPSLVLDRMWAYGFAGGAALDLGPVRARFGVGAYDLWVSPTTTATRSTTSELDFGYFVGLAGYPLVRERLRIGLEARAGLVVEAEVPFFSIGATLGGDAVRF